MMLRADRLSATRDGRRILSEVSFSVGAGEVVALVGPNGAGKSTLMRAALGLAPVTGGVASIMGRDAHKMSPMERARLCAYLPQQRPAAWPMRVRDIVALGRFAYGSSIAHLKGADANAVARALKACALADLADRPIDALSGGEAARVHLARAFATEAPILAADEPTAALDPLHAWSILELIAEFSARGGAALLALHDLALAARFASRVIVLREGAVLIDDAPDRALAPQRLHDAYGVQAAWIETPYPAPIVIGPA